MKDEIQRILEEYLKIFPNEKERQKRLQNFLRQSLQEELTDWNSAKGHVTVGAFVYCKNEDKFLVLYHKDLKMFLYPGGHVDIQDKTLFETAKRELKEETGLDNLELLEMCSSGIPFDIDTHLIPKNERVHMPEHYHFDFRYMFLTKTIEKVTLDKNESSEYKWITTKELRKDENYKQLIEKLSKIIE